MCGTVRCVLCNAGPQLHIFHSYRFFTVFCLDSESICEFRLRKQTMTTTATATLKTTMGLWRGSAYQEKKSIQRPTVQRTFPCALKIWFFFCAFPRILTIHRFGIFLSICRHSVVRWKIRNILSNHVLSSSFLFHFAVLARYTCLSGV